MYSYQITLLIGDRNHKTSTTLDERLNNDLFLLRIVFAIRDEERMVLFATVQRAPAMVKKANYAGNVVKM